MKLVPELLSLLTSDVRVVLWIESGSLSKKFPLYSTMNYLCDGLIDHYLEQFSDVKSVHFVHPTFEKPFHLIYIDSSIGEIEKSLFNQTDREKVVVVHPHLASKNLMSFVEEHFRWIDHWRS
jgi:hypothetical protein